MSDVARVDHRGLAKATTFFTAVSTEVVAVKCLFVLDPTCARLAESLLGARNCFHLRHDLKLQKSILSP